MTRWWLLRAPSTARGRDSFKNAGGGPSVYLNSVCLRAHTGHWTAAGLTAVSSVCTSASMLSGNPAEVRLFPTSVSTRACSDLTPADASVAQEAVAWAGAAVCCCLCSVTQSGPTLCDPRAPTRLLCPWGFSRQEYWSGLPCPPPGDLPNPGIEPRSPALFIEHRIMFGTLLSHFLYRHQEMLYMPHLQSLSWNNQPQNFRDTQSKH